MRLDLDRPLPSVALVTFSRRNLLALLHKLEMPGSARTLTSMDAYVSGVAVSSLMLIVRVEDDEEHYRDRPFPAGPMHADTEVFIAAQELLDALGLNLVEEAGPRAGGVPDGVQKESSEQG